MKYLGPDNDFGRFGYQAQAPVCSTSVEATGVLIVIAKVRNTHVKTQELNKHEGKVDYTHSEVVIRDLSGQMTVK